MSTDEVLTGRRVLLIEDEVMVAWVLEDMLAELGCAVIGPASSIEEALAMICIMPVDAVLLDVNLNGEMSYAIADLLAARGIPFVFSTGYDKDRLPTGYRAFPALQKPYHQLELADLLRELFRPKGSGFEPTVAAAA